jgi:hypothetical protein
LAAAVRPKQVTHLRAILAQILLYQELQLAQLQLVVAEAVVQVVTTVVLVVLEAAVGMAQVVVLVQQGKEMLAA